MTESRHRWFVGSKKGLFEFEAAPFDTLPFFVLRLNLLWTPGTLILGQDYFYFQTPLPSFEAEEGVKTLGKVDTLPPGPRTETGLLLSSRFLLSLGQGFHLFLQRQLFEKALLVHGPVSAGVLQCDNPNLQLKEIFLFGDRHDTLAFQGSGFDGKTHDEVVLEAQNFFQATRGFFQQPPDFDAFRRVIGRMKVIMCSPTQRSTRVQFQHLYIWEFLVMLLHSLYVENASDTIDVIVEDSEHMDFAAPERIDNYLEAVRHVFSICPKVQTDDSPFLPFVDQCHTLFPNIRYHRIDLRFALYEHPRGTFEYGDRANVVATIEELIGMKSNQRWNKKLVADLYRTQHHVDNKDDQDLLWEETDKAVTSLVTSPLWRHVSTEDFFVAFSRATATHFNLEDNKRSVWFFLRTCLTDLYGLGILTSCHNQRALVYLGDYHMKVWFDVLLKCFPHVTGDTDKYNLSMAGNRTVVFPAKTRKPLVSSELDWAERRSSEIFEAHLRTQSPSEKRKEIALMLFLAKENEALQQSFVVPYLSLEFAAGDPMRLRTLFGSPGQDLSLIEQMHLLPRHPDAPRFRFLYESVASALKIQELREAETKRCEADADVFNNAFDEMDENELASIYRRDNQCYSAYSMYKWWQTCYQAGKAFRDPVTRKLISKEERKERILDSLQLEDPNIGAPERWTNPNAQTNLKIKMDLGRSVVAGKRHFRASVVWMEPDSSVSTSYTLCDLVVRELKTSYMMSIILKEVIDHSRDIEFHRDTLTVNHGSIHFNNFRMIENWNVDPEDTFQRLLEELSPYVEDREDMLVQARKDAPEPRIIYSYINEVRKTNPLKLKMKHSTKKKPSVKRKTATSPII